ncbi:zinc finger HIT domain-containing protein 3 isoform X2 [Ischnura elegans]|uniref:zinc finger HIT domain-containing protein 3 isoform X2 n=1 Tax=Ischnura elegans TaxID=197161 RepID=UPI001ED87F48|nr:zinc finger HIT domain-containing protein 3 isoform X2 [Ischnura elegans]
MMASKTCEVCSAASYKYKCAKCLVKYCSVVCYNHHKASECKVSEKLSEDEKTEVLPKTYFFQTEDTVPLDKLSLLESPDLREILKDSDLRHMITVIDSSQRPSEAIQQAMQYPIFVKFVDECLRVVEP